MSHYPTQRDGWIVGVVGVSALVLFGAALTIWMLPGGLFERQVLSGIIFAAALFSLHLLFATSYDVTDDQLLVRCGIFRWRVPIDRIQSITPSRSLISGPALSLDRLEVRYEGAWMALLISPEDQVTFLKDIAARSPLLSLVDGTRLVRSNDD